MITDVNWTKGLIVELHSPELSLYRIKFCPHEISINGLRGDIPRIFIRVATKAD